MRPPPFLKSEIRHCLLGLEAFKDYSVNCTVTTVDEDFWFFYIFLTVHMSSSFSSVSGLLGHPSPLHHKRCDTFETIYTIFGRRRRILIHLCLLPVAKSLPKLCGCRQIKFVEISTDDRMHHRTNQQCLVAGASIPMGQGGHVPPIFGLGDIITNVPPIFLE